MTPAEISALPSYRVKNFLYDKQLTHEQVIVRCQGSPDFYSFILKDPERLVFDIKNAYLPQVNLQKETAGRIVQSVRMGQNQSDRVRLVVDLAEDLQYRYTASSDDTNGASSIKIRFFPQKGSSPGSAEVSPKKKEETKSDTKKATKTITPVSELSSEYQPAPLSSQQTKTETKPEDRTIELFDDSQADELFEETLAEDKDDRLSFSGSVHLRASADTENQDRVENESHLRNRILLESKYKNKAKLSVLSDYLYFGEDNENDEYDLELHEALFQTGSRNFRISLGRQIIRWGKTDQISPVDTINPRDFREFVLPEYEETKKPTWMADARIFFDQFTMEGVFIPFFQESEFQWFESDWAVFPHLKTRILNSAAPDPVKTYARQIRTNETEPSNEAEFGLRLTTAIENWDLGLSWHHTTEDMPFIQSFPVKNIQTDGDFSTDTLVSDLTGAVFADEPIEAEYKRMDVFGLEFETVISDFGFRGEAAWNEKESFLTSDLTSARSPSLHYVLGTDYTTNTDIYLNLQFAHRHIYDHTSDMLYFDRNTYSILGEVSRDLFTQWTEGSLHYTVTLNNDSWYLSPRITCTYITNLELIVGANLFFGGDDTWLGRYKNDSQFFMDLSYHF